jgi:hypothetical protein
MSLLTELKILIGFVTTNISPLTGLQSGLDRVPPHQTFQRLKLFQEPRVIFIKEADVVDAVADHGV